MDLPLVWARRTALAVVGLLPLAAWPGLERPFSTPKLYLLLSAVVLLGPFAWRANARTRRMQVASDIEAAPAPGTIGRTAAHGDPARPGLSSWRRYAAPLFWLASWSGSALLGHMVSPDALLLALGGGLFALILIALDPEPESLAAALVCGATGVAAVASAQQLGLDPFALAGWVAPIAGASPRLRIYGTLGNPNFVAALLAAAVPLTIGLLAAVRTRRGASTPTRAVASTLAPALARAPVPGLAPTLAPASGLDARAGHGPHRHRISVALAVALALQLGGLAATGSRAGALGLLAAGLTLLALGTRREVAAPAKASLAGPFALRRPTARLRVALAFLALVSALALVAISPARPLGDTLAGRFYIWHTVWPHALEAPLAGRGPGAFELLHPRWERASRPPAGAPAARFAGPQQHAHNDYLEALVDRGLAGPVTILAVLATTWAGNGRRGRRAPVSPVTLGAAAAVTALGAMACVDFPLARPAELAMFWGALALAGSGQKGHS